MIQNAIEIDKVNKHFGGIKALNGITLSVRENEFHSIIGENGAGKSTLMKILSGAYKKDSGLIKIFGNETDIGNPILSRKLGIGIIYQEFSLANDLSIAENIFLGNLSKDSNPLTINFKALYKKSKELLNSLGFDLNPKKQVGTLPVAYQQIVEIAKALSQDAKILILDEPTAVLTDPEIDKLFELLNRLKEQGVTIIYISHRLDEVFKLSDRVSVLKDGNFIATKEISDINKDIAISLMTGRDFSSLFPPKSEKTLGDEILSVVNLSASNGIHNINLSLRKGEIIGLSGLVGAGRTEFAKALFGIDKITSGTIKINGKEALIRNIISAKKYGIGLIPEDRKKQGLILEMSTAENMTMAKIFDVLRFKLLLNSQRESAITREYIEKVKIKVPSIKSSVGSLSGGNQQKVVISKWLNTNSQILILDEPTRGVDVGAKYEIYQLINTLAEQGFGIIFISSELPEIIGISDRVLVFNEGTISGELNGSEITEKRIMDLSIPTSRKSGGVEK